MHPPPSVVGRWQQVYVLILSPTTRKPELNNQKLYKCYGGRGAIRPTVDVAGHCLSPVISAFSSARLPFSQGLNDICHGTAFAFHSRTFRTGTLAALAPWFRYLSKKAPFLQLVTAENERHEVRRSKVERSECVSLSSACCNIIRSAYGGMGDTCRWGTRFDRGDGRDDGLENVSMQ